MMQTGRLKAQDAEVEHKKIRKLCGALYHLLARKLNKSRCAEKIKQLQTLLEEIHHTFITHSPARGLVATVTS